jgi:O-antigen/teichoic acid export membrane protein
LSSYQRFDIINLIALSAILIRTALVVALLSNEFGLVAMSVVYASAEAFIRMGSSIFATRLMSGAQISLRCIDRELLREMMTYGVSTILYMSGAVLIFKSADLVIGSLISTADVSRFYIATTPVLLMIMFIQAFARAMKPAVSDLDARDEHARIEEMALLTQKYTLMSIIPGLAFLLIMGRAFLTVWLGERFPDPSVITELTMVLQALALGAALRLTQHTNFIILVGKGDHAVFGVSALFMIASCAALSVGSVLVLDAGIVGVAWSCSIPMAGISLIVLPIHFSRVMKLPLRRSARQSWLPAALASIPAIAVILLWNTTRPPQSWFEIIGAVSIAGAFTMGFGWFIALAPVERERLRRVLPF